MRLGSIKRFLTGSTKRVGEVDIIPPEPQAHRTGLAICAIMRNEERHIGDWLRFHAAAGVRDFYLYDNLSSDETVRIARAVPGIRVTILPWKLKTTLDRHKLVIPQQIMAYCHAISCFGAAHRWIAFIDIDEMLVLRSGTDLLEALAPLESYSNISLPWTMFGPCGHETPPEDAAPFAYTRRSAQREGKLLNFKSIVDPSKVIAVAVHNFQTSDMGKHSANDSGFVARYRRSKFTRPFWRGGEELLASQNIQLNHYYTRSLMEMESKTSKGDVAGFPLAPREIEVRRKLALIEAQTVVDTTAADFLVRKGITNSRVLREQDFTT